MGTMAAVPIQQRIECLSHGLTGVDRENKQLLGFIVAEAGPFKSKRGEFSKEGLTSIVNVGNSHRLGLKSRFTHPGLSSDGLGTHLGRATKFRLTDNDTKVRADLQFADVAFKGPKGDLAGYVMDLAETDPDALGTSVVIVPKEEFRLNKDGTRMKDEKGEPLPPLWTAEKLFAVDVVDTGDATNSMLSAGINPEELTDHDVRQVWEQLNQMFAGQDRLTVQTRCASFLTRYLDYRFGVPPVEEPNGLNKLKLRLMHLRLKELGLTV